MSPDSYMPEVIRTPAKKLPRESANRETVLILVENPDLPVSEVIDRCRKKGFSFKDSHVSQTALSVKRVIRIAKDMGKWKN